MASLGKSSRTSKTNGYLQHGTSQEWDDALPIPKLRFPVAAFVVFCSAVLCFANSHDGDFVFDDSEAIIANKDLLPETPLETIFTHDFWGRKLDSKSSHKSYRPLTVMTYRWNYALAGGLHPWGFHVVNIVLHGLVSSIFMFVVSLLLSGYIIDEDTKSVRFSAPRASLLCGLLFATHPIHTESVAGVVGRADLLCALSFFLSFFLYAKSCSSSSSSSYRPESVSVVPMMASMCLCVISTFCKEQGITVIGVCSAFDIVVVCRVNPFHILGLKKPKKPEENGHDGLNNNNLNKNKQEISPWVKSLVVRHAVLVLTGVMILIIRFRVMGSTTPTFQVHDNPHSFVNGTIFRILNYNYLYAINSWLLLNPWWLCFDWSMGCIPVISSVTDPRILMVLAFWVVIGCLVFHCCCDDLTSEHRILIMSLALLVVPFLPASNVFFRVGFVIAERILYLSSGGFCILVTLGARQICQGLDSSKKQIMTAGLAFLVIIFTARSVQRSYEWRKDISLFSSGSKVCPLNAKVHYNIAKLEADLNNVEYAIEKYKLAIELNPKYDQAMNNLANILKDQGQLKDAEELLERALSIRNDFAAAWMNLGIVQAELKKNESAERSYLEGIRHRRNYPDCYYNLGNLYLDLGRNADAIRAWLNATSLKPTHLSAWTNAIILLDNIGRQADALAIGNQALKELKNEPQLLFNIANIYGKMDKYVESEELFLAALARDKLNAKLHLNLGVLYHRWGKYQKAEVEYLQARRLTPNDPSIQENLRLLYKKLGKN